MGSIRSLATIAILGVVAAFLYVKINEAPMPGRGLQGEAAPGVPSLTGLSAPSSAAGGYDANTSGSAPAWSAPTAAPPATTAAMPGAEVATGVTSTSPSTELPPIPAIPDMPDLPDLSAGPSAAPSSAPAVPAPTGLPANIPTAQYSGVSQMPPDGISGRVPSLGTATPGMASTQPLNPQPPATPGMSATPSSANADSGLVAVDASSLPGATAPAVAVPPVATVPPPMTAPPMTPPPMATPPISSVPQVAAPAVSSDNRYGEDTRYDSPPADTSEKVGVSSFTEGWPAIQAALERGELARAHLLLSQWYEDPSLTPTESQQVETLLSQLAGTVVYSTDHQLEPAHVVQPGETLETIAGKYNVPWQLLAKINGIPAANQVRPGQTLKVIRGPFSAVVELNRQQLTLMLNGRYAGKFPINVLPGATLPEGEWVVQEKPASPTQQNSPYAAPSSAVARSLRLRNANATDANPGVPVMIGSSPALGVGGMPSAQTAASPYQVHVAPSDAEELADILSVGSRVEIRR
jgi:LysM repeat protein